MTPLFRKLNLGKRRQIHFLRAPESSEPELRALEGVEVVRKVSGCLDFAVAFVVTQANLDAVSDRLVKAAEGGAVLGENGFEPVRQVAIDEDWTAQRARRVVRRARRPR